MLAVCLTGEMRWPELTLAAVNEMILRRIPTDRRRTYHVGPSDPTTSAGTELLLRRLGIASAHDSCPYHPTLSWEWGPADINGEPTTPFDATFNGRSPCTSRDIDAPTPMKLRLNARSLPVFKRCGGPVCTPRMVAKNIHCSQEENATWRLPPPPGMDESSDEYDLQRAAPCQSAISLVMQLWQCKQCIELIRAAEHRSTLPQVDAAFHVHSPTVPLHHNTILRLRMDLFFFHPVALPRPAVDSGDTWYSLFESTCDVDSGGQMAGSSHIRPGVQKHKLRFLQDFVAIGSRRVMDLALTRPLDVLLEQSLANLRHWRSVESRSAKRHRSMPEYFYHPLPHTLIRHFNASRVCVRAEEQRYGLTRVNVALGCLSIQSRVFGFWKEIGDTPPKPSRYWIGAKPFTPWLDQKQITFLRAATGVFRRCFGLRANASCPRLVGDTTLSSKGPVAECLRAKGGCSTLGTLPAPSGAEAAGFDCVSEGLRQAVASTF